MASRNWLLGGVVLVFAGPAFMLLVAPAVAYALAFSDFCLT